MNFFEEIKSSLPNFSDQIIRDCILPLVGSYGWPPIEEKWGGFFHFKSSEFWRSIEWEFLSIDLSFLGLHPQWENFINGMIDSYGHGTGPTENSVDRIQSILSFLKENKILPKPIVLFRSEKGVEILDGCHRISAYRIFINENQNVLDKQDVWMGTLKSAKPETHFSFQEFNWD